MPRKKKITREGIIKRLPDRSVLVQALDAAGALEFPGVECINPDAPLKQRIYQKIFRNKEIFFPHEYELAVSKYLRGKDVVVFGMNGYSDVSEEKCRAWGVKPGAYEIACASLFEASIVNAQNEMEGISIRIVHGASNWGVDKSGIAVGRKLNLIQLGFSCPRFMLYVLDDDIPLGKVIQ